MKILKNITNHKNVLVAIVLMTGLGVLANPLCAASSCNATAMSDCCACDHDGSSEGPALTGTSCCSIDESPANAPSMPFLKVTPSTSGIEFASLDLLPSLFDPSASSPMVEPSSAPPTERTPQRVNLRI